MHGNQRRRERKAVEAEQLMANKSSGPVPSNLQDQGTKTISLTKYSTAPTLKNPSFASRKPNQSTKYHLPGFWDALSTISLTRRALQEFDRRNDTIKSQNAGLTKTAERQDFVGDIKRFARHGGPDLRDIQGYPEPSGYSNYTISSSRPGTNRVSKPSVTNPNTMSSKTKKTGRSSAYDPNFERFLTERYVDLPLRTYRPANLEQWKRRMKERRASLSPSTFADKDHEIFLDDLANSKGEPEIMRDPFIKIRGTTRYPSATNRICGNWAPLLSQLSNQADLVAAKPDYFEGNKQDAQAAHIRRDLDTYIVPSSVSNVPFLPNFFIEAKSAHGSFDVAQRQACYDGALGARGMHTLQNYRLPESYDNNAYTVSVVFLAGLLEIYAHHISQPEGSSLSPHYHMTEMRSVSIKDSPEAFREGVTALRNLRDMANEYREQFIIDANRRFEITEQDLPPGGDKA